MAPCAASTPRPAGWSSTVHACWNTATTRCPISCLPYTGEDKAPPLLLTTAKSGWFVHTSHRHVASLRRKAPDTAVEIGPALAAARALAAGDWALVRTSGGAARLKVRLNPALDATIVVAEFGWWEACVPLGRAATGTHGADTANINAILGDAARDPVSGSAPLRAARCEITSLPQANRGRWQGGRRFIVADARAADTHSRALALVPEDGGDLPDFLPGQHVVVRLPEGGPARAYSLTGPPASPPALSIAVRRNPAFPGGEDAGFLSHRIQNLQAGDALGASRRRVHPPVDWRAPAPPDRERHRHHAVRIVSGGAGGAACGARWRGYAAARLPRPRRTSPRRPHGCPCAAHSRLAADHCLFPPRREGPGRPPF